MAKLRLEDLVAVVHGPGEPIYKLHVISTLLSEAGLRPEKAEKEDRPLVGAGTRRRQLKAAEEAAEAAEVLGRTAEALEIDEPVEEEEEAEESE